MPFFVCRFQLEIIPDIDLYLKLKTNTIYAKHKGANNRPSELFLNKRTVFFKLEKNKPEKLKKIMINEYI